MSADFYCQNLNNR